MKSIVDIILALLKYITGNAKELPDFDFMCERSPMSDSNPLFFLVKISNNSKNDYSIKEAVIFKRNDKTKRMLVHFKAIMKYKENIILSSEPKNRTEHNKQNEEINTHFNETNTVYQIKVPAKNTVRFFVYYKLEPETHNYWNNFRRKTAVKGFVGEDGTIFPEWRKSDEWELSLKDDRNIYWIHNREKIALPILQEECRINNYLSAKIKEGDNIFFQVVKSRFNLIIFKVKYYCKSKLLLLGINNL